MKTCYRCNITKGNSEFNRDRTQKDGLAKWCKSCMSEYRKEYRAKHPDRILASRQKDLRSHDDRIRAYKKVWHQENRARLVAKAKQYYIDNYERIRATQRMAFHAKRADGEFTFDEWQALCERYDYRCVACQEHKPLSIDHIVPVARGGSNTIDNIQPLCKECNSRKKLQIIDYRPDATPSAMAGV